MTRDAKHVSKFAISAYKKIPRIFEIATLYRYNKKPAALALSCKKRIDRRLMVLVFAMPATVNPMPVSNGTAVRGVEWTPTSAPVSSLAFNSNKKKPKKKKTNTSIFILLTVLWLEAKRTIDQQRQQSPVACIK